MKVILLSGDQPDYSNELTSLAGVPVKSRIPLLGKPMVQWVAEALLQSKYVDHLIIVGMKKEDSPLPEHYPATYLPMGGSLADKIITASKYLLENFPEEKRALICASDIPLLKPEMVDWFVEACGDQSADFYFSVIEKESTQKKFPGSGRSFQKMRDGYFAGGDLSMINPKIAVEKEELVRKLTSNRKNFVKQVWAVDKLALIKWMLGKLDSKQAEKIASKALGIKARLVVSKYPELGMDVDKVNQLYIVKQTLEEQHYGSSSPINVT